MLFREKHVQTKQEDAMRGETDSEQAMQVSVVVKEEYVKKEESLEEEAALTVITHSPKSKTGERGGKVATVKTEKAAVKAEKAMDGARPVAPADCNDPLQRSFYVTVNSLADLHKYKLSSQEERSNVCAVPNQKTVLDSLVGTMLSQNTTDVTSARAFGQLKAAFPTWQQARVARVEELEATIKCCGLAKTRAERIQAILNRIHKEVEETGANRKATTEKNADLSLEWLRDETDEAAKRYLTSLNGVGPKTAACVLMFCMGRGEFPVDTHVWRISKRLGWVGKAASREDTYERLNALVPESIKHDLHVLLVMHGKSCMKCSSNGSPRYRPVGPCPLRPLHAATFKPATAKNRAQ
eukprot:g28747.t1